MSDLSAVVAETGQDWDGITYVGIYNMDGDESEMFAAARVAADQFQVAFYSGQKVDVSREELERLLQGLTAVLSA